MIAIYALRGAKLAPLSADHARMGDAVWIDLLRPTEEEEAAAEAVIGLDAPTREDMEEIEVSSRLYRENGAAVMTALVLSHTDADDVIVSPATFILSGSRLLTIRYEDPRTFDLFARRAQKAAVGCASADAVLAGLLEALVDRLADILERAAQEIEGLSRSIFRPPATAQPGRRAPRPRDFRKVLEAIGAKGDLTSKISESLLTLQRLLAFLSAVVSERNPGEDIEARVETLARDAQSLSDHAAFLSQKITFLLDATLGLINIEQSGIIKIFSVAAVVFLPPTLIASIYGMNFDVMPELAWPWGYPLAIILMVLSAVLPYLYFKHRGWL